MLKNPLSRPAAVSQALFVTFLWSTSWVLIKTGLENIPALTFAGMRYMLAFLCLLPFTIGTAHRAGFLTLTQRDWWRLALYGFLFIAITQGAQFLGLALLPAVTVSLMLNFTPVVVALMGAPTLKERPTSAQWGGIGLYAAGILDYFYPAELPEGQIAGLLVVGVGVLANALSSIMGRQINREGRTHPLTVTVASMGVGATILLAVGALSQGMPTLTLTDWVVVIWLAAVNTALAFPLWHHTMRTLTAVESSIINGTMLVQIALLAWIFLGESLSAQDLVGMTLAGLGALLVQLRPAARSRKVPKSYTTHE